MYSNPDELEMFLMQQSAMQRGLPRLPSIQQFMQPRASGPTFQQPASPLNMPPATGGGMDPMRMALLAAGLQMLQNSGPSTQQRSLGQIVGAGGMQGLNVYAQQRQQLAQEQQMAENSDLRREQIGDMRLTRQANMAQMEANAAEKQRVSGLMAEYSAITDDMPNAAQERKRIFRALAPEVAGKAEFEAGLRDPRQANSTQYERALNTLQDLQIQTEQGKPLTRAQELQAQSARTILEQQRPGMDPATGQLYFSQPLSVPPGITVGGTGKRQANTLPSLEGGRKALDAGTEKKFTDLGNGYNQITAIQQGFKPEYGGFVSETAGQLAIAAGRRGLPQYSEMANFWQQYEQWITDMRAAKFGMTLTGYELEQFNKYRSRPSDKPELIQKNMQRQLDLVNSAAQRELNSLNVSGQNVKQGEALSGIKRAQSTKPASDFGGGYDADKERRYQEWKRKQQ